MAEGIMKGSFTLPDLNGFTYKFVYNPTEINTSHKVEWGAVCVPGASHPVYQYGSGGEQLINFDLFIDGERGIVAQAPRAGGGGLDIKMEVNFLESLELPIHYEPGSFAKTRPPVLIFNFGTKFVNVECIMKSVSTKHTQFTHDGQLVKATVQMQLGVQVDQSRTMLEVADPEDIGWMGDIFGGRDKDANERAGIRASNLAGGAKGQNYGVGG